MRHLYDDEIVTIDCDDCGRCSNTRKRILHGEPARVVREHPNLPGSYDLSPSNLLGNMEPIVCPRESLVPAQKREDYTEEKKQTPAMPEPVPAEAMTQPESPKFDNYGYGPACGDPSCRAMQNEDHVKACARTGTFRLDK